MNTQKKVVIITIPLVYYHGIIYWGLYTEHTGKIRQEILYRPTAGKQVSFAFSQAMELVNTQEYDVLIAVDDKFTFERSLGLDIPTEFEIRTFVKAIPLPLSWVQGIIMTGSIVQAPEHLACGWAGFSEKELLVHSAAVYGLQGECSNQWVLLLEYLEKIGYRKVQAYIPRVCAKNICYATPYSRLLGIWKHPITLSFTEKDTIVSEHITK